MADRCAPTIIATISHATMQHYNTHQHTLTLSNNNRIHTFDACVSSTRTHAPLTQVFVVPREPSLIDYSCWNGTAVGDYNTYLNQVRWFPHCLSLILKFV